MTENSTVGEPDKASIALWGRLNREERWPNVQYGPTEPLGEPQWCVSMVNPCTREFFALNLSNALRFAEAESDRLRREEVARRASPEPADVR